MHVRTATHITREKLPMQPLCQQHPSPPLCRLGVEFVKRPDDGKMKGLAFVKDPDGYWVRLGAHEG